MNHYYMLALLLMLFWCLWAMQMITSSTNGLIKVVSTTDGRVYHVLPERSQQAADLLASILSQLVRIISELKSRNDAKQVPDNMKAAVQRLLQKYPNGDGLKIYELDPAENHVAYNVDKSEIFLCLRANPTTMDFSALDTIMIIAIHELAHSMTEATDPYQNGQTLHSRDFKECEAYLLAIGEYLRILDIHKVVGRKHCGIEIPSPFLVS